MSGIPAQVQAAVVHWFDDAHAQIKHIALDVSGP